jgi:ATP-dependent DNA ligase
MRKAFAELPTQSAILDGELCRIDPRGAAHFYRLMREMRTRSPDESQLMVLDFDLLHQDGVNLRSLTLTERKADLDRLCRRARNPFLAQVETFPDGEVLHDYCNRFGFEGVVSKRRSSRYSSGPSRHWFKVKCPDWKRANERQRVTPYPPTPLSRAPMWPRACGVRVLRVPWRGRVVEIRKTIAQPQTVRRRLSLS